MLQFFQDVQKVDNAISWITIHWIVQLVSLTLICWIGIYPADITEQLGPSVWSR